MSLVKRNSFNLPTFPRFFDDFFTKDLSNWEFNNFSTQDFSFPNANIVETNTSFEVEIAAPGMNKKDFQIELNNEVLKISAQKEVENNMDDDIRFVRREYNYQSFERSFHLPKTIVDDSKIDAKYKDGILKILIPKREEAKALPPRTIQIK